MSQNIPFTITLAPSDDNTVVVLYATPNQFAKMGQEFPKNYKDLCYLRQR